MRVGHFCLQLIDAETKNLFQEHSSNKEMGKIYAEVEPDREYYIKVTSYAPQKVFVHTKVDGHLIEESRPLKPGIPVDMGVWSEQRLDFVESALKFDKQTQVINTVSDEKGPEFWTGTIEAHFFGAPISPSPDVVYRKPTNFLYTETELGASETIGYSEGLCDPRLTKGVKTVRGESVSQTVEKPVEPSPKKTKPSPKKTKPSPKKIAPLKKTISPSRPCKMDYPLLGMLQIHYCSAVGLIHAGILDKPPGFDIQQCRSLKPRTDNWRELSNQKVKKIRIDNVVNGTCAESQLVDMFDLVNE